MPRSTRLSVTIAVVSSAAFGGFSISAARDTSVQVDVSHAAGPQNEASIAVHPRSSNVLVAASQNFPACAVRVYGSTDGGSSWTSNLLRIRGAARTEAAVGKHFCGANQWVAIDASDRQYVAFLARDLSAPAFDGQTTWSLFIASRPTATGAWSTPGRVDASLRGVGADDKPMLSVDTSIGSPHRGRLYVAWTRYAAAVSLVAPVLIAYSDDHGRTWSTPSRLGKTGGWGVHLALASDGTVFAAWWSGTTLVIVRSAEGGVSFPSQHRFASLRSFTGLGTGSIPAEPTEPVHPDPSLSVDRSAGTFKGRIYAAYSKPTDHGRRIFVTVFDRELNVRFTRVLAPQRRQGTYDEFNPTVAVDDSTGIAWSCFYVTGTGTARRLATYSCTTSRDGGRRWTAPAPAASVPSDETRRGAFTGRISSEYASYEGLAVADGVAHPIWTDTRKLAQLGEEIYTTSVVAPARAQATSAAQSP